MTQSRAWEVVIPDLTADAEYFETRKEASERVKQLRSRIFVQKHSGGF